MCQKSNFTELTGDAGALTIVGMTTFNQRCKTALFSLALTANAADATHGQHGMRAFLVYKRDQPFTPPSACTDPD